MAFAKDRTGERFGRLVAVARVGASKSRNVRWLCRCDCGSDVTVSSSALVAGATRSCGCLRTDLASERKKTHGLSGTRAFKAWDNARRRCYQPKDKRFPKYGGRGIGMCQRWRDDFASFYEDMGECPPGMTIERIDVDGDYEPSNCKWADRNEQAMNRRSRVQMELNGEKLCLAEYCRRTGDSYSALKTKLYRASRRASFAPKQR